MKNKQVKGFTLIELIVVMAVMSILMVGIMQMIKPIRNTYVDSTYYEAQRNTQNGISTYIGESLRYATNIGIYNEKAGVSGLNDALNKFENFTGISDKSRYNVITINNKDPYVYNSETCYGRVVRSKSVTAGTSRLALGEAYYGKYTYSINVVPINFGGDVSDGLEITVTSLLPATLKQAKKDSKNNTEDILGYRCVQTVSDVPLRNMSAGYQGKIDTAYAGTETTSRDCNTYIVFTLDT